VLQSLTLTSAVWSHLYSFSFDLNPSWTREYPGQEEIQAYLIRVAHKYQLYQHIRFNSSIEEARWDDRINKWRTTVRRHGGKDAETREFYSVTSDFLVSAVGQLNMPRYPDIQGLSCFQGKVMHSARWDWDYELRGKRIGIIGTGATAAQIVPEVAKSCEQLVVFQRTPTWVIPRHDQAISQSRQLIYKYIPITRKQYRARLMRIRESFFDAGFDPDSAKHEQISNVARQHMLSQLPGDHDAPLRELLTPDYPFSCKRIVLSDDYYPALARSNVALETRAIANASSTGIALRDGTHHDLDVIISATGFKTTQFMHPIRIFGRNGLPLSAAWAKGASAYLGMTIPSFPNFGMLYGPNTNLAYNSLILQIEAQSLYINALISAVLRAKSRSQILVLSPKREIVEKYNEEIQDRLSKSTFANPKCTSWFKDENGKITTNWAGSAVEYQKRVCFVKWSVFEIEGSGGGEVKRKGVTRWRRRVEESAFGETVILMGWAAVVLGLALGCCVWAGMVCW